jgi:hypothetical protein
LSTPAYVSAVISSLPDAEQLTDWGFLDIHVSSPVNEHADLPAGMQMFAQLIVDGIIVHQTTPVDLEDTQDSRTWKFLFDCDMLVSSLSTNPFCN